MEPTEHNGIKKVLTTIAVFFMLVVGVYFFVFHKTAPAVVLDQYGNPTAAQTVGSDLIALSTKLQNVTLNDAIFHKDAFIQLTDFNTTLPTEAQGRANPFQSLGH